jgi:hypothetical protein
MPWHDATPWRARKVKPLLSGPDALAAIEKKLREGDLSLTDALRVAFMAGFQSHKERRKAKR